jgi:protein O-GlcNAc transferase
MRMLSRLLQIVAKPASGAAATRDAATAELESTLSEADRQFQAGDLPRAETSYARVLQLDPGHARAHYMLSEVALKQGDIGRALTMVNEAIALEPANAGFHSWLASLHASRATPSEAIRAYQEAIRLKPDMPEWHAKLGALLAEAGRLTEALAAYRARLAASPEDARAHFDLGDVLLRLGQLKPAESALRQAASMAPEAAGVQFYLAMVLRDQGRPVEAEESARRAVAIAPDMPQGWFALGSVLSRQAKHVEAAQQYRKAISLIPDYDAAWDGLLFSMNYSDQWSPREVYEAHLEWGRRFPETPARTVTTSSARPPRPRVRIGYLSPDFRHHSVTYFIEPVLEHHDPARFEVFCYDTGTRNDVVTTRLKGRVEHWRSMARVSHEDLERVLRADELDILVELSGHSDEHRLPVLARRVAPVQVTYLGYPNTTGLPTIDYRVTDALADPQGDSDNLHVETLVRLPGSFLCYRPPERGESPPPRPFRRKGHITFGSFNNFPKITPTCIALWAEVLSRVPASRLLIKTHGLQDPGLRALLMRQFNQAGVGNDQLSILPPTPDHREHLQAYGEVDIALDTFPYHGTTTTLDALWMGVPVITLAGDRHASRVGVSIMSALELTELVARTPDRYVEAAVQLACNVDELERLSGSFRRRLTSSPITDGRGFAAKLETAYLEMLPR